MIDGIGIRGSDALPIKFLNTIEIYFFGNSNRYSTFRKIQVFNYGNHKRDFTYIDDIVEGLIRVIDNPATPNPDWSGDDSDPGTSSAPWRVYNIGNNNPVELMDYIEALENSLGIDSEKELLPLQPGDVPDTYADVDDLVSKFSYKPQMNITEGVDIFVKWYKGYYSE